MALSAQTIKAAAVAARAADEKSGSEIVALDLSNQLILSDVFLLVSGANDRQLKAISDEIERQLSFVGEKVIHREGGVDSSQWLLLDYGDLIVHIQSKEMRTYYALDRLWGDCPIISLPQVELRDE
ncbi:MAG: ribosome silencing factor [Actinobacteria bacterium]|uniref:Unannotated protein n=1 Tax=freshwater metagenome TaxID=449393 RepID=A0A6J6GRK8_9ZZZZ|nr:ribosome silencing factor [Actinomycetota bacterium]MSY05056.1 ribosome silencing factor [Actinomycetota bacterium]MSY67318.1 ribosome silencing factor [Actinomycetota bacterium]MSZ59456.1 ribosome silencing factor [Actinomycetota bacterium]MTA00990.1 ribosome silencing factor [Actinomycetota bacterium]